MKLSVSRTGLVDWALLVGGLVNLGLGSWRMWTGDATLAAAGLSAGLILLVASTVERFELVKGLGMEAKTREITQKIDEAKTILDQVRRVATISGSTLIQLSSRAGRWDSATPADEAYRLVTEVTAVLKAAGSSEDAIREARLPWAKVTARDLVYTLLKDYLERLQVVAREMEERLRIGFKRPIQADDPVYLSAIEAKRTLGEHRTAVTDVLRDFAIDEFAERLRSVLKDPPEGVPSDAVEALRSSVDEWAQELEYLAKHLDLRSSDKWLSRLALLHREA